MNSNLRSFNYLILPIKLGYKIIFKRLLFKLLYTILYIFLFLSFEKLISLPIYSNTIKFLEFSKYNSYTYSLFSQLSNDFVDNIPILKVYGPLTLDINNVNFDSSTFFIPALNGEDKPFFLAINCDDSLFNIMTAFGWKGWFRPFFNYETLILEDFCKNFDLD